MTGRRAGAPGLLLLAGAAAAQTAQAPRPPSAAAPAPAARAAPAAPAAADDGVAVLAALDKRLGTTAEFRVRPGERFRFGRLEGLYHGCERTQPHERPQSGAFVQLTVTPPARRGQPAPAPERVFSGWLFAESPSLNPFVHPVYDVWLRSCTMRMPDGPAPARRPGGTVTSGAQPKGTPSGASGTASPPPAPESSAPQSAPAATAPDSS